MLLRATNKVVEITFLCVFYSTGEEQTIEGKATIPDTSVPAKLKVKFNCKRIFIIDINVIILQN